MCAGPGSCTTASVHEVAHPVTHAAEAGPVNVVLEIEVVEPAEAIKVSGLPAASA
jgi:hypothetical protein